MPRTVHAPLPIVVVDDEPYILHFCQRLLTAEGYEVVLFQDGRELEPYLAENRVSLVILDLKMPIIDGHQLLNTISEQYPQLPVLVITALSGVSIVVECMRSGASDFMVKPLEGEVLLERVRHLLVYDKLREENRALKASLFGPKTQRNPCFEEIITNNEKMHGIFRYLESIADSDRPIMILGETGVGKELVARAIHRLSRRKRFVAFNVSSIDESMFADTLFGHRRGAFPDATRPRSGLLEKAGDGTLFLDEIGDLDIRSQVLLLRLLQDGEYYPLGADDSYPVRSRLLIATNRDLRVLVEAGRFRKDLYFRLMSHQVLLPPLRDRLCDVPLLLDYFLEEAATSFRKKVPKYPDELLCLLQNYSWPGNVRELEGMAYEAMTRHRRGRLSLAAFKEVMDRSVGDSEVEDVGGYLQQSGLIENRLPTIKEATHYLIEEAMRRANGNQTLAARLLGISRSALNKRLNRGTKD